MKELKPRIHENGIDYILVGDYYVPDWKLPEEHRPIGRWGNLHRAYLRQFCPALYSTLVLSGELHTYLADLNEQATERCSLIIEQMAEAEGVDEAMKAENQMLWVQSMNSIRSRAEEIIMHELFYPQLGVKLCSMAGGGVQKIYMVFLREPSRRDRSGSDLFHLWDGFEIKMNFDRNVSCFIFVNALMHDDFFD